MMTLVNKNNFLALFVLITLHVCSIESIDSHGNAVYTFMEISDILDEWCKEATWTKTFMTRFIECRHKNIVSNKLYII